MTTALEQAYDKIRKEEKFSPETCVEELCKVLLIKLYYERKNEHKLIFSEVEKTGFEESIDLLYNRLFQSYVPSFLFETWEVAKVRAKTFGEIIVLLEAFCFTDSDCINHGTTFTSFMQAHFGGYINDFTTPTILTKFIFEVLDVKNCNSVFDPCCGIGGFLAEAYQRRSDNLKLYGNDISRMLVNISRLHLKIYGYDSDTFSCLDYARNNNIIDSMRYDCIVAHIPTRLQVMVVSGGRKDWPDYDYREIEEIFIDKILKQLTYGGSAAIIVPNGLLEKHSKRNFRHYLLNKTEILNITKFEDVAYSSNPSKYSYQIIFLKNTGQSSYKKCSATLLNGELSKETLDKAAHEIKNYIENTSGFIENKQCKMFSFYDIDNWNISLLFLRDKIGDKYTAVRLSDLLIKKREAAILIPDKEYKVLRVRRRGMGVAVKRTAYGRSFKEKMYPANTNDLVVSSFEADMGGVGFVPKDLDNAIVNRDLYLFVLDKDKVDLNYLKIVLTSDPVLEQLQAMNKRTYALSRLSLSNFLSVMIPLPDLEVQKTMAKDLQSFIDNANKAEKELAEGRKCFIKNLFG